MHGEMVHKKKGTYSVPRYLFKILFMSSEEFFAGTQKEDIQIVVENIW